MRIGRGRVGGLDGRDFGAQAGVFGVEFGALGLGLGAGGLEFLARLGLIGVAPGGLLQAAERRCLNLREAWQGVGRKLQAGVGLGALGVGAHEPIAEMKQFAQRGRGGLRRDGAGVVNRAIAQILDDLRLGDERVADDGAEGRLVNEGGERFVIGRAQRLVALIHPFDGGFQSEARVKTGGARIGQRDAFRFLGVVVDRGEFGLKKGELRHEGAR